MKHTPSPWFYTTEGKDAYGIVEKDGTNVMHMQALQNSTGASNMEANMRLIAAAPDLLAALQELVSEYDHYTNEDIEYEIAQGNEMIKPYKRARAIIAKATQGEPT